MGEPGRRGGNQYRRSGNGTAPAGRVFVRATVAAVDPTMTVRRPALSVTDPGQVLRPETWSVTTADHRWTIERSEEPGTPWTVYDRVSGEAAGTFRTQRQARTAVTSGRCDTAVHESRRDRIVGWVTDPDELRRMIRDDERRAARLAGSSASVDRRLLRTVGTRQVAWLDRHLAVLDDEPELSGGREVRTELVRWQQMWVDVLTVNP